MQLTVEQLAKRLGAELLGDGAAVITGVGPVDSAGDTTITFVASEKHLSGLAKSHAAAVIIAKPVDNFSRPQLVVENVNAALIESLKIFAPKLKPPKEGIDPSARIGEGVQIGKGVSIGPNVVIDDNVRIGDRCVIDSGCKIGENSKLGSDCRLYSNVVIYHNCIIGNNCILHANSTIGATGFGYYFIDGAHRLIPHNGGVIIEDFVEIGANSCVDRAKFDNTIIGAGTKIDNLVQIAHNVVIGKCCLIAGQVGIAGSSKLGDGVVLGGHGGVTDNVELGDGVMVGATSVVFHSVAGGKQLFGIPADEKTEAIRRIGLIKRLPKIVEQLKQLAARVAKLEASKNDKE